MEYQILKQGNGQSMLRVLSCANYSQIFTQTGNMCHSWTWFDQNFQIRLFIKFILIELINYFETTAPLITKAKTNASI